MYLSSRPDETIFFSKCFGTDLRMCEHCNAIADNQSLTSNEVFSFFCFVWFMLFIFLLGHSDKAKTYSYTLPQTLINTSLLFSTHTHIRSRSQTLDNKKHPLDSPIVLYFDKGQTKRWDEHRCQNIHEKYSNHPDINRWRDVYPLASMFTGAELSYHL